MIDGDTELVVEPPEYAFVPEGDARLRCFVFNMMANSDIDGRILAENCQTLFEWIKNGTVPAAPTQKSRAVKAAT